MKMNKKGFTLIELLAVIVILAIIALIATPIVLGIINDARKSSKERSVELVASGAQNAYTSYMMKNNGNEPTGVCDFMTSEFFTVSKTKDLTCTDSTAKLTTEDGVSVEVTLGSGQITTKGNNNKTVVTKLTSAE